MMKLHRYIFLIIILATSMPNKSIGASFDCAATSLSTVDQWICQNPKISALDERMAIHYQENYKKLSPYNRVTYLNSQREWLRYWPQACGRTEDADMQTQEYLSCAENSYEERIETLRVFITKKQWPVFNVAQYHVTTADKKVVPDWVNKVEHQLTYPKIDAAFLPVKDQQLANQVNLWIRSVIKTLGGKNRTSLNENHMDTSLDIQLEEVSPDLIRLKTIYYFNGFGAHGNSVFNNYHYIISKGRELKPPDLLQGNWQELVAKDVYRQLHLQAPGMVLIDSAQDVKSSIERVQTWMFDREGLRFIFSPYELTAYAAGAPQISVDWELIKPYLTDYTKTQLPLLY
jgi:uncharacterized protein